MSDDTHNNETEDSNPMKVLRDKVKELEGKAGRAEQLERELAFVKAGVNLETKAGQYFAKAYEGEMNPDAIRSELAELGLGSAPPKQQEESGEEQIPANEAASTDERGRLVTNASAEPQGEHPRVTAINEAEASMANGATREAAIGEAFAKLAVAAYQDGDQRVIYDPRVR